jgi:hypothetical protein
MSFKRRAIESLSRGVSWTFLLVLFAGFCVPGRAAESSIIKAFQASQYNTSLILDAAIQTNALPAEGWFEYGTSTNLDTATAPSAIFDDGTAFGVISIKPFLTYYLRFAMKNESGTNYSNNLSVTTTNNPPRLYIEGQPLILVAPTNLSVAVQPYDLETSPSNLVVTALNLSPELIPDSNISISRSNAQTYRLVIESSNTIPGLANLALTVRDEFGLSTTQTVQIDISRFALRKPFPVAAHIAVGDFNGDSFPDLVSSSVVLSVLTNDHGKLTSFALTNGGGGEVVVADFDNNGTLEILHDGSQIFEVSPEGFLAINNWPPINQNSNASPVESLQYGDFDNDGFLDILFAEGLRPQTIRLYRNLGDHRFAPVPLPAPGMTNATGFGPQWIDYDGDGWLDISYGGNFYFQLLRNNRDGTFTQMGGTGWGAARWVDFNGDGLPDLFTGNRLLRNEGPGKFAATSILASTADSPVIFADLDGDGRPDIFSSPEFYRNVNGTSVRLTSCGLPNATFSFPGTTATPVDLRNIGALDLIVFGAFGGTSSAGGAAVLKGEPRSYLLQNRSPNAPPPPPVPRELAVEILPHNNVLLRWHLDPSERGNLTFNARIGTTPTGLDILSPLSDPVTGWRRVVAHGNAGYTEFRRLQHLRPGTYHWSAQSINAAFQGSGWAAEQSFTITNEVDLAQNHVPLAFSAVTNMVEDETISISLGGTDADGDPLDYLLQTPPQHGRLEGVLPHVVYIPATNFFGEDSFTYTVFDGATNSLPAVVTVDISGVPDSDAPTLSISPEFYSSAPLLLTLTGEPYGKVTIEYSSDLKHWTNVDYYLSGSGSFFQELVPTNSTQFIRVYHSP